MTSHLLLLLLLIPFMSCFSPEVDIDVVGEQYTRLDAQEMVYPAKEIIPVDPTSGEPLGSTYSIICVELFVYCLAYIVVL